MKTFKNFPLMRWKGTKAYTGERPELLNIQIFMTLVFCFLKFLVFWVSSLSLHPCPACPFTSVFLTVKFYFENVPYVSQFYTSTLNLLHAETKHTKTSPFASESVLSNKNKWWQTFPYTLIRSLINIGL